MRMPHWIAAVALALVAGALIGWFAGASSNQEARRPAPPPSLGCNGLDTQPSPAPIPEKTPLKATELPAVPTPVSTETPPPTQAAGQDWTQLKIPTLVRGDGTFLVRVQDPLGQPIEGIEVSLRMQIDPSFTRQVPRTEFESDDEYIDARIKREYVSLKLEQQATLTQSSNAEGRIEFGELPGTRCHLNAKPVGYLIDGHTQSLSRSANVGEEFTLILVRAAAVTVTVAGAPEGSEGRSRVQWEPADGSGTSGSAAYLGKALVVSVLPGAYEFIAHMDNPLMRSDPVALSVGESDVSILLTLTPRVRREIVVQIDYTGGEPLAGFTVVSAPARPELRHEEHLDRRRLMTTNMKRDPGPGYRMYRSGELEPGAYVVGILDGSAVLRTALVNLGETGASHVFEMAAPGPSDGVTCIVRLPEGAGEVAPAFDIRVNAGNGLSKRTWKLREDAWLLVPTGGLPKQVNSISVEARIAGLGGQSCEISGITGTVAEFTFAHPSRLTLKITNVPEALRRELSIGCQPPDGRATSTDTRRNNPVYQGDQVMVAWGPVQAGSYEFWISRRSNASPELVRGTIRMDTGKDSVLELKLADMYEVTIEQSGVQVGNSMTLHWTGQTRGTGIRMGADGKCIVPFLPAGSYTLKYTVNREPREQAFSISGNSTVYLTE